MGPLFVSKGGIYFLEGTGTSPLGNPNTLKRKMPQTSLEASFRVQNVLVLLSWKVAMSFSLGSDSEPLTLQADVA